MPMSIDILVYACKYAHAYEYVSTCMDTYAPMHILMLCDGVSVLLVFCVTFYVLYVVCFKSFLRTYCVLFVCVLYVMCCVLFLLCVSCVLCVLHVMFYVMYVK